MDPKNLFITIAIVLVGIVASTTFVAKLDASYGGGLSTEVASVNHTRTVLNSSFSSMGIELGDSPNKKDGAGTESGVADLTTRSLQALSTLPKLLGIIPTAMKDGAAAIGIPEPYTSIAVYTFIGVFGITMAYIFIMGVKSLFG